MQCENVQYYNELKHPDVCSQTYMCIMETSLVSIFFLLYKAALIRVTEAALVRVMQMLLM